MPLKGCIEAVSSMESAMQVLSQWARYSARLVSIPAATLIALAGVVIGLSKLSIAAASEDVRVVATPAPQIEQATFPLSFEGIASYYAHAFHGRRTAHGKRFDMYEFTAAHRKLPFGTILRVTNPRSGECLLVEINDRGPFVKRRVLDLSYAAANALDLQLGTVRAEGFTPNDMVRDSLVLLFVGIRYEPYWADPTAVTIVEQFDNFSRAVRAHRMHIADRDMALAVLPSTDAEGKTTLNYALVRLSPLVRTDDSLAAMLP
ncbi:MAG: septal ring lytic transglycosylase RlpA family protein [Chlorobi bacterium]|nr:septal ring lytic transglycosylase RlpA family protein [Chlorobiota bacterium]